MLFRRRSSCFWSSRGSIIGRRWRDPLSKSSPPRPGLSQTDGINPKRAVVTVPSSFCPSLHHEYPRMGPAQAKWAACPDRFAIGIVIADRLLKPLPAVGIRSGCLGTTGRSTARHLSIIMDGNQTCLLGYARHDPLRRTLTSTKRSDSACNVPCHHFRSFRLGDIFGDHWYQQPPCHHHRRWITRLLEADRSRVDATTWSAVLESSFML